MRVLFIGNSFTARNDLPGLVAAMARARGDSLEHELISAGGASLRMHWNKGVARRRIEEGHWDVVVLQEQSTLPVKNAARMHENVRLFVQPIESAGAKPALYLTWARRNAPGAQQLITEAYRSIARETGALVIPAGVAWEHFQRQHPTPVLHDRDLSHPTPAGSYLAACVCFATLFGQSPVGLEADIPGVSERELRLLQEAASAT